MEIKNTKVGCVGKDKKGWSVMIPHHKPIDTGKMISQCFIDEAVLDRCLIGVKKVIVQPDKKIIVVIFNNGEKSIVKCTEEDTFNVQSGVAIAIAKYVLGSGSELKKLVKSATVQKEEPNKEEAKKEEVKIEVGDTVKIIAFGLGDYGEVISYFNKANLCVRNENSILAYRNSNIGRDYWVLPISYVKLFKKGDKK